VYVAEEIDGERLTLKQKQENRIVERVIQQLDQRGSHLAAAPTGPQGEELTKFTRFMESARIIAASAVLAAMIGAGYEYLTLAGVVDMSPARVVLFCFWFFGSLFVWEIASFLNVRLRHRVRATIIGAVVIAFLAFGLDKWTLWWRLHHPPEIARFTDAVLGMRGSIQQLGEKVSAPHVEQSVVKEIQAVPGYLKQDWGYAHLPLEKPDEATTVNVVFANKGSTYTHDSTMKGDIFYVDYNGLVPSPLHDEEMSRRLKEQVAKITFASFEDIAPGAALWSTYSTRVLTQNMYNALEAGTARIYFAAYAEWTTNKIPDHVNLCVWLQPVSWSRAAAFSPSTYDPSKADPVWHTC
jgi:hypothetical protein